MSTNANYFVLLCTLSDVSCVLCLLTAKQAESKSYSWSKFTVGHVFHERACQAARLDPNSHRSLM